MKKTDNYKEKLKLRVCGNCANFEVFPYNDGSGFECECCVNVSPENDCYSGEGVSPCGICDKFENMNE